MVPKAGVKHYLTHFHFFCRAQKDGSGGETQIGTPQMHKLTSQRTEVTFLR